METQPIKNYVWLALTLMLLAFAGSAVSYVYSYARSIEPSSFRSFSVSGEGKVIAVPDVAKFTFQIVTQGGTDVAALRGENSTKANAAVDFLKQQGVDKKDIEVAGFSVDPRYEYYNCRSVPVAYDGVAAPGVSSSSACPPPKIVGYTVTQTVAVKVRDFEKVGSILAGIVDKGANSVSQLSFTIDDPTKLQDEARAEAIAKAKEKAAGIAKAGGFSMGRLLNIMEGGVPGPYYYDAKASGLGMGGAEMAVAPSPVIEPGSQEVRVNITLVYEIK